MLVSQDGAGRLGFPSEAPWEPWQEGVRAGQQLVG